MENELEIYKNALSKIESVSKEIENELNYKYQFQEIMESDSTLDSLDYCYVFLFGMMGAFLSTNKKLKEYLAEIHNAANDQKGEYDQFQVLMGKLFHHSGDSIDLRRTRNDLLKPYLHRLYWGHDILSFSQDNPFYLMVNQKGLGGILQALRHLIADTMSKEGLPMPGSSLLDYVKENGKTSNYFIDIISAIPRDNGIKYTDVYSSLFTIKALDIAGGTLARLLVEGYIKTRKIESNLRKSQIIFMVYAINFFTEAVIGAFRQKGIPYINIPVGAMMITSFAKFSYLDSKETKIISKQSEQILEKSNKLIEKYENQLKLMDTYDSFEEMIDELDDSSRNMDLMVDYFGGKEDVGDN